MNKTIIIMCLFVAIGETRDFCKAFNSNHKSIGFGYKHNKRYMNSKLYLVIDRHFWDIEFRDHPNDCYKQIRFTSMVGKESDWFWSEYKMGFSLANNDNDYTTGLVSKYTQTIYWGKFSGNDLYESQCLGALHINFGHFKPTIAFAFNPNTSDENVVCFVDQKRQKSGTFVRKLQFYKFSKHLTPKPQNINYEQKVIQKLDPSLEVIAIFSTFSEKSCLILNPNSCKGNGFIILFKSKQSIKYCYSCGQELSYECEANRLKQLIDCTESDDRFGPIAYHHWLKTSQPRLFSAIKLSLGFIIFAFIGYLLRKKLKINFQMGFQV